MKSRTSCGFNWDLIPVVDLNLVQVVDLTVIVQVVDLTEISFQWWIWMKSHTSGGFKWNLVQVVELTVISYKWWI